MQITDHTLTIDSVSIDLPRLAIDAMVHVWIVPVAYQANGYFVSVQIPGQPMEIPACDGRDAAYLGALALEADEGAKVAAAKDAAIQAAKDACQAALVSMATRFSDLERQTWERQLAEATALLDDPSLAVIPEDTSKWTDPIPTIRGIVAITDENLGDFAMSVQKNHEDWTAVSSNIIGQRQKIVDDIKKCETMAEVAAVSTAITMPA